MAGIAAYDLSRPARNARLMLGLRRLGLPAAIDAVSLSRWEELCRIVVSNVTVRDRAVRTIERTPQVRPFFENR